MENINIKNNSVIWIKETSISMVSGQNLKFFRIKLTILNVCSKFCQQFYKWKAKSLRDKNVSNKKKK